MLQRGSSHKLDDVREGRQNGRVRRRLIAQAKRRRLMEARPNFRVHFSKSQVAASLWDYGEDVLADHALEMTDEDLSRVQAIAAHYEDPTYSLPVAGQRITHNHVTALAAITFFEGELRPLTRIRRRVQRERPTRFTPQPPDPASGL